MSTKKPTENKPAAADNAPAAEETFTKKSDLQVYYRHKVKAEYETVHIAGLGRREVLKGYRKAGECLQETSIETRHADVLNDQTPNSMQYYFTEGQDDFIPADKWF